MKNLLPLPCPRVSVTMRISIPTHMKLLICQRMDMLWDLP